MRNKKKNKKIEVIFFLYFIFEFKKLSIDFIVHSIFDLLDNFFKMNVEMQSAEIKASQTHAFVFNKPVKEYMIGFSSFTLQYNRPDHHVKRISVDLSDNHLNGTEIVVDPHLLLRDDNDRHIESLNSTIFVTVIAVVGEENPYFRVIPEVNGHSTIELPVKPVFIKSTLITSDVQYPEEDHHVWKYWSQIVPVADGNTYIFVGEAKLQDNGSNSGSGKVKGSVLIYTGGTQDLMCADFDSRKIGDSGYVCLGKAPESFDQKDYDVACFVNRYEVSFESPDKDHHVLKVEIGASLGKKKLVIENDKVYAKVYLKSFLVDNGEHQFDIPHNSVSGFVIAFKNQ